MSTQAISTMSRPMTTPVLIFSWACRIVAAIILLQTLFFKFTAAPESVYIFTKLGAFIHTLHSVCVDQYRRGLRAHRVGNHGVDRRRAVADAAFRVGRRNLGDGGYRRSYR